MSEAIDIKLADRLSSVGEYWFSGKLREMARLKELGAI